MKPKEFDELVRQKFDQNDFEYNPRNWDKLAEELDGRAKKRNVIMWWWMPLAGVAASVALAMAIPAFMKHDGQGMPVAKTGQVQKHIFVQPKYLDGAPVTAQMVTEPVTEKHYAAVNKKQH